MLAALRMLDNWSAHGTPPSLATAWKVGRAWQRARSGNVQVFGIRFALYPVTSREDDRMVADRGSIVAGATSPTTSCVARWHASGARRRGSTRPTRESHARTQELRTRRDDDRRDAHGRRADSRRHGDVVSTQSSTVVSCRSRMVWADDLASSRRGQRPSRPSSMPSSATGAVIVDDLLDRRAARPLQHRARSVHRRWSVGEGPRFATRRSSPASSVPRPATSPVLPARSSSRP